MRTRSIRAGSSPRRVESRRLERRKVLLGCVAPRGGRDRSANEPHGKAQLSGSPGRRVSSDTHERALQITKCSEARELEDLVQPMPREVSFFVERNWTLNLSVNRLSGPPPLFTKRHVLSTTFASRGTPPSSMNLVSRRVKLRAP